MTEERDQPAVSLLPPPGGLAYVGPPRDGMPLVDVLTYDSAGLDVAENVDPESLETAARGVRWVRVRGIHDPAMVEAVGRAFSLHPLTLEDVLNTQQRPKLEDYGDYLLVVLKHLAFDPKSDRLEVEQVSLVLGKGWVVSFQESEELWADVLHRVKLGRGRIRRLAADYLFYSLCDSVVDDYFEVLEKMETRLDEVETQLEESPGRDLSMTIYRLKRECTRLRKAVWPLREVMGALARRESRLVGRESEPFFRDLYDHTVHIIDTAEGLRDSLGVMMDLYLSAVSNRMNEIMKVLTVIATIFIPLTFLAGVYGMNFKYMPELEWWWAYPALWGVMIGVALCMLWFFRKKGWL